MVAGSVVFSDAFWIKPPLCFLSREQRHNQVVAISDLFSGDRAINFQPAKQPENSSPLGCCGSHSFVTGNDCDLLDWEVEQPIS